VISRTVVGSVSTIPCSTTGTRCSVRSTITTSIALVSAETRDALCVVEDTLVIDRDVGFLPAGPLPWTGSRPLHRVAAGSGAITETQSKCIKRERRKRQRVIVRETYRGKPGLWPCLPASLLISSSCRSATSPQSDCLRHRIAYATSECQHQRRASTLHLLRCPETCPSLREALFATKQSPSRGLGIASQKALAMTASVSGLTHAASGHGVLLMTSPWPKKGTALPGL
jgi:hypothetical protein